MEMHNEYRCGSDLDEDALMKVEMRRMRDRGDRFERQGRNNVGDEVDGGMNNIKMCIPPFKGMSDLEAYLEWEKRVELIFEYQNYSEEKKVMIAVLELTDYVITWWDKVVTSRWRHWRSVFVILL